MTNHQLNRLIKLLKKTGEKTMVLDQASDEILVLMPFDAYEDLLTSAHEPEPLDPDNDFGSDFFAGENEPIFNNVDDEIVHIYSVGFSSGVSSVVSSTFGSVGASGSVESV